MDLRPTDAVPIGGRIDARGCLVSADAPLERLQVEAGSALGRPLALPQLAALARAAASLQVPLSRALVAADARHDIDLFVRAEPDGNGVALTIERWVERPAAGPRLALVQPIAKLDIARPQRAEFETDRALTITSASRKLADLAGRDVSDCIGLPLTAVFRLVEGEGGAMPLLSAVASRSAVEGQVATIRGGKDCVTIDGEPLVNAQGEYVGLRAWLRGDSDAEVSNSGFDESLDQALRSPLDRIIDAADRIVERSDGPLRSDYATYAGDIAAAGRHLLSVIRGLGGAGGAPSVAHVNLAALAEEAAALVRPLAIERAVQIGVRSPDQPCRAVGEARAVVQILVNIIGNAVRHSPTGSSIEIAVTRDEAARQCSVTVSDDGPGIALADQQRIFERYEQAGDPAEGTGLGLAISRRLARSLGGDVTLRSVAGEGSAFTLALPLA